MFRKTVLLVAFIVSSAMPAFADDVMASRYGNTTISTDASGVQSKLYYAADGTFTGKQANQSFNGTWKLDGGNICLTFAQPVPGAANPTCFLLQRTKWATHGRQATARFRSCKGFSRVDWGARSRAPIFSVEGE